MTRWISEPKSGGRLIHPAIGVAIAMFGLLSDAAYAYEAGVSFRPPGRFSCLAPSPPSPYSHSCTRRTGCERGAYTTVRLTIRRPYTTVKDNEAACPLSA